MHDAAPTEGRLLAMIDDRQVESVCVFHRSSHHPWSGHWTPVVRHSDDSGVLHFTHFGEFFSGTRLSNRSDRKYIRELGRLTFINHKPGNSRVVVHRIGVWHRADASPTSGNGR